MITDTMFPTSDHANIGNTRTLELEIGNNINRDDLDFTGVDFLIRTGDNISYTRTGLQRSSTDTLQAKPHNFLLSRPQPQVMHERFRAIQKWEGYVIDADDEVFRARLIPLKGEGCEQEAEIFLSEITHEDRAMIQPGAKFYWSIGYLEKPSGTMRASIIRFRRLPTWTAQELTAAETKASELKELLGV